MTFDYFLRNLDFLKSELFKSKGTFTVKMSCESMERESLGYKMSSKKLMN